LFAANSNGPDHSNYETLPRSDQNGLDDLSYIFPSEDEMGA
jgi:hypothetical protein